jgi:hypothetical protein
MLSGKGLADRPPALERSHRLRLRRRSFSRKFVLRRGRLELFQRKLHLIEKTLLAFRTLAVKFAAQLFDHELLMRDQRFLAGQIRLGAGRNGLRFQARGPLGKDHCMRGGKIGGKRFRSGHHGMESHPSSSASQKY